ncbi:MAG: pyruvate kinase [Oscillospiraceae bacterium]|nr:pyruvate kinase [Oscillospiraceae bacterium]
MNRKTKIVCTIGPASDSREKLSQLIDLGMNVARLNFSHGSHEEHGRRIKLIQELRDEKNKPVSVLLDTKGPEIRLGLFENGSAQLQTGARFTLTTRDVTGNCEIAHITYSRLPEDISVGTRILLDDGLMALNVDEIDGTDIHCTVLNGGTILNRKGVNVPGIHLSMPFISERDRADILFGIKQNVDYIAASFSRSAEDVMQIRKLLDENGGESIMIIAKIENSEGVENIDEILNVSDGVMVARGDMGVEIPLEDVPILQKMIIKKALVKGKHTITATQMLDSMTKNPRPTRAEATDVANAIYDGTSAIMLSGETAAGNYPLEAVETMARIAVRTEESINYQSRFSRFRVADKMNVTEAISHATCTVAHDLNAKTIITVTRSGQTARMISRFRPHIPIVSCTTEAKVYQQLSLAWGVTPLRCEHCSTTEKLFDHAVEVALTNGCVDKGDVAVLTGGAPIGVPGTTNLLRVYAV